LREWKASSFGLPVADSQERSSLEDTRDERGGDQDQDMGSEEDKGGPDSGDDSNAELESGADGDDMELDSLDNQFVSELEREIPAREQEARTGAPSVARRGPDKLKVEKNGSKVTFMDLSVYRSGHVRARERARARVQCGALNSLYCALKKRLSCSLL
jgi:hypothetical protein